MLGKVHEVLGDLHFRLGNVSSIGFVVALLVRISEQTGTNKEILWCVKNKNIARVNNNKISKAFKKLNLSLDSSLQDIKRQYKVLVKKYHPDANKNNVKSNNKLIEINEAYKIIIDNY